jgi:hypothetical protein
LRTPAGPQPAGGASGQGGRRGHNGCHALAPSLSRR